MSFNIYFFLALFEKITTCFSERGSPDSTDTRLRLVAHVRPAIPNWASGIVQYWRNEPRLVSHGRRASWSERWRWRHRGSPRAPRPSPRPTCAQTTPCSTTDRAVEAECIKGPETKSFLPGRVGFRVVGARHGQRGAQHHRAVEARPGRRSGGRARGGRGRQVGKGARLLRGPVALRCELADDSGRQVGRQRRLRAKVRH